VVGVVLLGLIVCAGYSQLSLEAVAMGSSSACCQGELGWSVKSSVAGRRISRAVAVAVTSMSAGVTVEWLKEASMVCVVFGWLVGLGFMHWRKSVRKSLMTLMLHSTIVWMSLRSELRSAGNNSSSLSESHVVGISFVRVIL